MAARGEQSLRKPSAPSSPPVLSIVAETLAPQPWAECSGHGSVPGSIIPSCWADPHTQQLLSTRPEEHRAREPLAELHGVSWGVDTEHCAVNGEPVNKVEGGGGGTGGLVRGKV